MYTFRNAVKIFSSLCTFKLAFDVAKHRDERDWDSLHVNRDVLLSCLQIWQISSCTTWATKQVSAQPRAARAAAPAPSTWVLPSPSQWRHSPAASCSANNCRLNAQPVWPWSHLHTSLTLECLSELVDYEILVVAVRVLLHVELTLVYSDKTFHSSPANVGNIVRLLLTTVVYPPCWLTCDSLVQSPHFFSQIFLATQL